MADPNWNKGFYYDKVPPHTGMKLARRKSTTYLRPRRSPLAEIATITYRSGPEWEQRFGRRLRPASSSQMSGDVRVPALCPDFLIETYIDHQVCTISVVHRQLIVL